MPANVLPASWEPQPPSQMRQASFLVRGEKGTVADISLVVLGGAAGNLLDNVNRWLSQLGQPSISAEQLTGLVQHLPTAKGDVAIVDLAGTPEHGDASKDGRIIAAMMMDQGKTSFFKMRGNAALAEKEKENFLRWVSAVCGAGAAPQTASTDAPPRDGIPADQMGVAHGLDGCSGFSHALRQLHRRRRKRRAGRHFDRDVSGRRRKRPRQCESLAPADRSFAGGAQSIKFARRSLEGGR